MGRTESPRGTILVMDGNEQNAQLLNEFLADEGFTPGVITELDNADAAITEYSPIEFAIVDLDRFGSTVWEHCQRLGDRNIGFIVLSGLEHRRLIRQSRKHGARTFVEKPIRKGELLDLITAGIRPAHP